GEGVSELLATTVDLAGNSGSTGLVNQRHAPLLQEALEAIGEAEAALASEAPYDVATVGMRSAVRALGEITGETASPDIVARVFQDFCIGK
ncbi:MAG: tRNA uridine-5-carboxymethylaminomethyl(34) synthesis GTPase MnmE, partial [Fimbriimonadaceae bacterium]